MKNARKIFCRSAILIKFKKYVQFLVNRLVSERKYIQLNSNYGMNY